MSVAGREIARQETFTLPRHGPLGSTGGTMEKRKRCLRFSLSFGLGGFCVFFIEPFHTSLGIHNFLGAREKWMTTGTDIDL